MNVPEIPGDLVDAHRVPRWSAGKASVRIAGELAISIAPPVACTTRQPISHSAPPGRYIGSNGRASAPSANTAKPRLYMRTRP